MANLADRLDGFQRRHPVVGFPLAVTYKFFDDQSNYLAAILTYYSFAAIFPLLLISSSVLGFLLQGDEHLKNVVLDSALAQFPIVGTQLKAPEGLQGSTLAVIIGGFTAVYGIVGLGQAAQNAVQVAWSIPKNVRPNPILSRLHSAWFLLLAGLSVIAVATLSGVAANADAFGTDVNRGLRWLAYGVSVLITATVFAVLMRVATPERRKIVKLLPGALVTAVLWQLLQRLGSAYVGHVVTRANDVNFIFALTLGLLVLIYIAANMAVIGVQINVVLAMRLWPRALLTPFTDAVELTDADRRAYSLYAKAQRHKGFETVSVTFDKTRSSDGQTPGSERPPDSGDAGGPQRRIGDSNP